jgi:hypothetical protein
MTVSMQPLPSDDEIDRLARKRAGAKMGWYIHLAIYLLFNLYFLAASDVGFGHRRWTAFPMFGWGLGLLLHGVSVFVLGKGSSLRERMVQRERERLLRQRGDPRP